MSDKELMTHVNEIKHTMDCEGLSLTSQNENDVIDILLGKRTVKDVKKTILDRYGLSKQ